MFGRIAIAGLGLLAAPVSAGVDEIAASANAFGLKLLASENARSNEPNRLLSPATNYLALSMLVPGTQGAARGALDKALGVPKALEDFTLDVSLLRRQLENTSERSGAEVSVSNRAYPAEKDFEISENFKNALSAGWDASLRGLNYAENAEGARKTINADIASDTNDRIRELLGPGSVRPDTKLVLTAALYFKAPWDEAFEASQTKARDFKGPRGNLKIPLMERKSDNFDYVETAKGRWLRVPYRRGDFQMIVGLPKNERAKISSLLSDVPRAGFRTLPWRSRLVNLRLPRFKVETPTYSLKKSLLGAGLSPVFNPKRGDFGPLSSGAVLRVDDVLHRVWLEVNEEGSEVAAATAVGSFGGGIPSKAPAPRPMDFYANRPFLVFLEHNSSGLLLVAGAIQDPSK